MLVAINIIIIINKQNYEFARVDVLLLLFLFPKSDNNIIHSKIYKVKYLYMYIDKKK